MEVLNGIKNFLQFINNNWTLIIIIIGLIVTIYERIKKYIKTSNKEKIDIAKEQIKEVILKLVSDAEVDYEEWNKAGSIKRSQVIEQIFSKYPILSKEMNQEELISWIDNVIDESLNTLRDIINKNKKDDETN